MTDRVCIVEDLAVVGLKYSGDLLCAAAAGGVVQGPEALVCISPAWACSHYLPKREAEVMRHGSRTQP